MANEYVTGTVSGTTQVQTYDSTRENTPAVKPHECHCAPDAPCRLSGKCTCMNSLLKKLEGAERKNTYKVLVGDDNEQIKNALGRALRARNMEVDLASTADEAIAKARANNYAAVITDLEYTTGGRQGYEVLDAIKELPTLKILFTGQSGFEFAAEGFEFGADHVVLRKDASQLLQILQENLQVGASK